MPLAEAAARLLPHFPSLQPPPGEPLRIFQGSYLREARLEQGSLVLLTKDARKGTADRAVLRAMATAYWADVARIPVHVPGVVMNGHYFQFIPGSGWVGAAAVYHQWVFLERTAGPVARAAEQELWETLRPDRDRQGFNALNTLAQAGAIGYSGGGTSLEHAFALWAAGEALGHDEVLEALRIAAERIPPPSWSTPLFSFEEEKRYWEAFCAQLGIDVAGVPPYFRWPAANATGAGR